MTLASFPPPVFMEEYNRVGEKSPLIPSKRKRRSKEFPEDQDDSHVAILNGRKKSSFPLVCIILAVLLERTTYYGILSNLVVFLTTEMDFAFGSLGVGNSTISNGIIVSVFAYTGMAWFMSTVGGFIGDSYSGHYNAIYGSLLIYILGSGSLFMITVLLKYSSSSLNDYKELSVGLTIGTLLVLSIGEGTYKANISAFGAEQLSSDDSKTYRQFFNWYYWAINVASFLAYMLLAYIQVNWGFFYGYLISLCCILLACVLFCIPQSHYNIKPASGNILKKVCGVIREAYRLRKGRTENRTYPSLEEFLPIQSWLDRAMIKYGGTFLDTDVEEVKTLRKISLIFLAQIPYWMIYFQMNSTFLNQGLHMNLIDISEGSHIPAAWLTVTDVIFVLLLIPVMDKLIYPWLDRRGLRVSVLMRISIGFLFAVAAMVVAGGVEYKRRNVEMLRTVNQTINQKTFIAADLSIMYQIPQYGLIGVSEVFASVGGLEFAYREAPPSMQSFVMGLFFFVQSIGSLLGAALYSFAGHVLHWTTESFYTVGPHLDCYFFLLGAIMLVSWLVFVVVCIRSGLPFFQRSWPWAESFQGSMYQ
ncbi:solute carrier family 15 member 4 isoform X2 [Nematostella vectensis]|uniref:solute carrier family 15 member 4 isoform X2 n=1 Tax=Nematostella vectensis TaxID=45351 RepID=UPI0020772D1D|nr:solute carrier family 15 member 4 isoform X2 [Nematostella vectensis]